MVNTLCKILTVYNLLKIKSPQILHSEDKIGVHKVDSAMSRLQAVNQHVTLIPHKVDLNASNALSIIEQYDLVLDCTDNATTRYLVNDCCVLLKKVLVSGAALRFEGQVSTYNYKGGPCYRCINPVPPDPEATLNCYEAGVLGPVTGIVGSLQAAEAIKILASEESAYAGKMMLVCPWDGVMRAIKLRSRQAECAVCGDNPSVTSPIDYVRFCGSGKDKEYSNASMRDERITCKQLKETPYKHLIDVRPAVEFGICALENSVSVPFYDLMADKVDLVPHIPEDTTEPIYLLCRAGINSQIAVQHLKEKYPEHCFKDIIGGLMGWTSAIDPSFPLY